MAEEPGKLRLFVAIYPPPEVAAAMVRALQGLRLPRNRPVPESQVHMTVVFLGDRGRGDVEGVVNSMRVAASGEENLTLAPRRFITLPERRAPRLVALEVAAPPSLQAIYTRLVESLAKPNDKPQRERLLPHFTLCRFARDVRAEPIDQPVDIPAFQSRELHLVASTLSEQGASHRTLRTVPLSG